MTTPYEPHQSQSEDIAIVGMSVRLPDANDPDTFWANLKGSLESIQTFSDEELLEAGVPEDVLSEPNYVKAGTVLDDYDCFDASFFGFTPREAEVTDPQHRIFLELSWHALEHAGHDPESYSGLIAVFAGMSAPHYLYYLAQAPELVEDVGYARVSLGNSKDFLANWVSYKLNLRGPAVNVQTACSTSLVAVQMACQSLLNGDCDMALAGGVTLSAVRKQGYFFQEGGINSPDGHCRAFDAEAAGTVGGSGAGIVVLKRFDDALRSGNTIYAVVKAAAINNDGSGKVGFTAPGINGQKAVIETALQISEIPPESISYVEAHGTGTHLGDPVEIAALTEAFDTDARGTCGIGSLKSNIGHLDVAAGVAGLIKTTLALHHKALPATLHYHKPNPQIQFDESPFYVVDSYREWESGGLRRAGVSSFGIGGTNAHVILEEAPERPQSDPARPIELILLSAKSEAALQTHAHHLSEHLRANPELSLTDVAATLRMGRQAMAFRSVWICDSTEDAALQLAEEPVIRKVNDQAPPLVFTFPGQGNAWTGHALQIYQNEPFFRKVVGHCSKLLEPHLGESLIDLLYPDESHTDEAIARLGETDLAQPAIFVVQYALAKLWQHWGIVPESMIGHSVGEYTVACLAGVFSLEDALFLVATRGRLMQQCEPGAMLSVRLSEEKITPYITAPLDLAVVNGPDRCVVSGPIAAIDVLVEKLDEDHIKSRRLDTSRAFHSAMMDLILDEFANALREIKLQPNSTPYISSLTGTWITHEQATDLTYWVDQLRNTVRFDLGLAELAKKEERVFLEVGSGQVLTVLTRAQTNNIALPTMSVKGEDELKTLYRAIGRLWQMGQKFRWSRFEQGRQIQRLPLPLYPFERTRYFIDHQAVSQRKTAKVKEQVVLPAVQTARTRIEQIGEELKNLIHRLFGFEIEKMDTSVSFFEMGVDSLLLMQAHQAVQEHFGLEFPYRVLFEECQTMDQLVAFLDEQLPADRFAEQPAVLETTPGDLGAMQAQMRELLAALGLHGTGTTPDLQALFRLQLDIIMGQLDVLKSSAGTKTGVVRSRALPEGKDSQGILPFKPVQHGAKRLSHTQQNYLDVFIRRFNEKTGKSKQLNAAERKTHADPRSTAGFREYYKELVYPIIGERSNGSRLWDVDGNEYVDLVNGFGSCLLGHNAELITQALSAQMTTGLGVGAQSNLAGKVADLIVKLTGVERVAFSNTGSEAVMNALRIARTATGRKKLITFTGSYHGIFDGVSVRPNPDPEVHNGLPVALGITPGMVEDTVVLPYGLEETLEIIEQMEDLPAAVIVEPVQSRRPDYFPIDFLKRLRELTAQKGICLIFDEVITGFRSHQGGAQALAGVQADLVIYGKVLGGGMPLGVVAGTAHYMDAVDGGTWSYGDQSAPRTPQTLFAGTFCKHPLTMAASLAVLKHLDEVGPEFQDNLNQRAQLLVDRLQQTFDALGAPIQATRFSSLLNYRFTEDVPFGELFGYFLSYHGLHVWGGGTCFITTAHTDEDFDFIVSAFQKTIESMRQGGLFPVAHQVQEEQVRPEMMPLTLGQRQIWAASQLGNEAARMFNESLTMRLTGKLNLAALEKAFSQVVERHQALRLTIDADGHFQTAHPKMSVPLRLFDLSTAENQEARSQKIIAEEVHEAFDLTRGPLLRAALIKCNASTYILVLTLHHIIMDGGSAGIILGDLKSIYIAACAGTPAQLPVPGRFSDYVAWLEKQQRSAKMKKARKFWLEMFRGEIPTLDLPTDRPRPNIHSFSGAKVLVDLDADMAAALHHLSAEHGTSIFTTMLSTFTALLYRLGGKRDVIVGIGVAGQFYSGIKHLVGYCLNQLPIRSQTHDNPTFASYLSKMRSTVLDAIDYQIYSIEKLTQDLSIKWVSSGPPLIMVNFNYEQSDALGMFGEVSSELQINPNESTKTDIFLNVIEQKGCLTLDFEYNTMLFDDATARRWLDQYQIMLRKLIADPSMTLDELTLLDEAGRDEILLEWNQTNVPYPATRLIHELFTERATEHPNATALIYTVDGEARKMSYGELEGRANHMALTLHQKGLRRGMPVGLCMDRSPELVVALLAILKCGGIYLPLDPAYPKERLGFMLEDAAVGMVITNNELVSVLPDSFAGTRILTDGEARVTEQGPQVQGCAEQVAYIMYTSGSTGRPKGVMVPHRAVLRLIFGVTYVDLNRQRTLLHLAPISFDAATFELWGALLHGARCVLHPERVPSVRAMGQSLQGHGVDTLFLTTALFNVIVDEAVEVLSGVRQLLMGGEKISVAHIQKAQSHLPDTRITHVYGPTESTTYATFHPITTTEHGATIPIGRPIANTHAYILDERLEPTPVGIPGELFIGGDGLALGYLARPGLTAGRWIPSPFNSGQQLYRTGDLARYDATGAIEFIGRRDHQVKIHGFRIELGEIMAKINEHESIRESAVLIIVDRLQERRIAAFCVVTGDYDLANLRPWLLERLPNYMVPTIILPVETMPLTPNGKVDRKALEQLALTVPGLGPIDEAAYVPPRTEQERELASIWAKLLQLDQVGIDDNFFELSGDSILAIQVSNRARQIGLNLTPRLMFEHQTIRELAESGALEGEITQQESSSAEVEDPFAAERFTAFGWDSEALSRNLTALESADDQGRGLTGIEDFYPLSSMQEGMLFHTLSEPDTSVYVTQMVQELKGEIDREAFELAWQSVIDNHPVMRTHFAWKNFEKPVQVVNRLVRFQISDEDWTDVPSEELESRVADFLAEDQRQGFDLSAAPLHRMSLIRLNETTHLVAWSCHHIILDGWSMPLLFGEMSHYYQGAQGSLPKPPPFRDYIAWLGGRDLDVARQFWRDYLAGFSSPTPLCLEDPVTRKTEGGDHGLIRSYISRDLTARLEAFSRNHRLTLNTIFQGTWAILLSAISGERDVVFGSVTSGRPAELASVEHMVGLFINTLPCRVRVNGHAPFAQWLSRLQHQQLDAHQHGYVPLVKIQSWSDVPTEVPLFDSIMAFESMPVVSGEDVETERSPLSLGKRYFVDRPHNPLSIKVFPAEEILIEIYYDGLTANHSDATHLIAQLTQLLEQLPGMDERPIAHLDRLNGEERKRLLVDFNDTQSDYPELSCHQIFEQHAARNPNRLAVFSEEVRTKIFGIQSTTNPGEVEVIDEHIDITYGELNANANRLARFMRQKGIGSDTPVAILMDRTVAMITIMIAVHKAGGAYVPLDVTYPIDRITFVMKDTASPLVLSESFYLNKLYAHEKETVCLDMIHEELETFSDQNLDLPTHPDKVANVIYTSGSTGTPKGVLVTHRGIVSMFHNTNYIDLTPEDCWAQTSNTGFDVATFEIWGAMLHGARLVIIEKEVLLSPAGLSRMIEEHKITCMMLPTAVFNKLAQSNPTIFNTIKNMNFGGEAVDADSVRRVLAHGGPKRLLNLYGPTETTCCVTWEAIEQVSEDSITIPIGIPVSNTSLYVLDDCMMPVPSGAPGELLVGGSGLARGYYKRPGLTASIFVPDPFGTTSGARLYRTGDVVRFTKGGRLVFVGRADKQVKIRGYRIEPGEIQNALKKSEDIKDAVVVPRSKVGDHKQLVAYVVAAGENEPLPKDLMAFLRLTLPDYMIPEVFVNISEMPLTANGKLDTSALPDPDQVRPEYVAPRNDLETTLADVWAEVLKLKRVGIHDNYFMLGGDSIIAIQITAQVEKAGFTLTPKDLFLHPTIADLAETLNSREEVVDAEVVEGETSEPEVFVKPEIALEERFIQPLESKDLDEQFPYADYQVFGWDEATFEAILDTLGNKSPWRLEQIEDFHPLSPSQEGMFFETLYDPDPDTFKTWIAYEIEQDFFDVDAFYRACQKLMDLHPILRTAIHWRDVEQPLMVVIRDVAPPFEVLDWREERTVPHEIKWLELIENDPGFDFTLAPLLRLTLIRFKDKHYRLLFRFHHILMDGWCLPIILQQLFQYYGAGVKGEDVVVEKTRPYRDYIAWLSQHDRVASEAYWRTNMKGFSVRTPIGFERTPDKDAEGTYGRLHSEISEKHTNRLEAFAKKNDLTVNTLVQAAWALLLSYYSGLDDIVYGITTSGRPSELSGVESIIGLFSGAQPARFHIGQQTLLSWLQEIQDRQQEDRKYQYNSLPEIKSWTDLPAESPLYESLLSFQNFPLPSTGRGVGTDKADKLRFSVQHMPARVNTPFTLMVFPAWELSFNMYYDERRFRSKDVTRIWRHFNTLLLSFIEHGEDPINGLSPLDDTERRKLLASFSGPRIRETKATTIDALFEEQAARTPDALAVYFREETLTFAELDQKANQLARFLCEQGVGPENRVAISMGRSVDMIVSLIAILKTGAAYVAMEPDYPLERSAFILEDSGAVALLMQEPEKLGLPGIEEMARLLAAERPDVANTTRPFDLARLDLQSYSGESLNRTGDPGNLAYVIYTSGSTGIPKGVLVDHQGPIDLLNSLRRLYTGLEEWPARVTMNAPISFDVSVGQIIMLLEGSGLFIVPEETRLDSRGFIDFLERHRLDVMDCTPSHLAVLLDAGLLDDTEHLPARILVAGSAVSQSMWDRLAQAGDARFHNLYGPTEATVYATGCAITRPGSTASIGRPLANVQSAVLNEFLRPLPIGVSGQLYLGGPGLARGYLARPALTAERFIPDPFAKEPGQRLYKTGDQVRAIDESNLEFLGRLDDQVKIRGFRIEIGEIEACLAAHDEVSEAVVLTETGDDGEKRLVAYVVCGMVEDVSELRQHLNNHLPRYMEPDIIIKLDAMPRNPAGKVDRRALADSSDIKPVITAEFVPPSTELEHKIAALWCDVLGLEKVGIHDRFLDLGGHSLLMVRIHDRLRQQFDTDIHLAALFEAQTIHGTAALLGGAEDQTVLAMDKIGDRASKQKAARERRKRGKKGKGAS